MIIKKLDSINFLYDESTNEVSLSFREYARVAGKDESTIRYRASRTEQLQQPIIKLDGLNFNCRAIPIELCLQWLVKDDPKQINRIIDTVRELTSNTIPTPDLSELQTTKPKKDTYSPLGFIYLFEDLASVLKVGFTKNVQQRLKQLQRWDGELSIVNVFEATIYQEKEIHKILHATGKFLGDEWYPFQRKSEVMDLLLNYSGKSKRKIRI